MGWALCTRLVFYLRSRIAAANSVFSIHFTYLFIRITFVRTKVLQDIFSSENFISTLLKLRFGICQIICILRLANRNIFSKKQDFLWCLQIQMLLLQSQRFFKLISSIFWVPTFVCYISRLQCLAILRCIVLTFIPKFMGAKMDSMFI